MHIPDDIPWSQAFLDQRLSDEPLKTFSEEEKQIEQVSTYPFRDDFYKPIHEVIFKW